MALCIRPQQHNVLLPFFHNYDTHVCIRTHAHTHTHRERERDQLFLYGSASASTMDKEDNGAVLLSPTSNQQMQGRFMGFGLVFYSLHRLSLRGGCFFLLPFSYCDDDQGGRGREKETRGHDMHACLSSIPRTSLLLFPSASKRAHSFSSVIFSPFFLRFSFLRRSHFSRGGGGCGGLRGDRPASVPYLCGY